MDEFFKENRETEKVYTVTEFNSQVNHLLSSFPAVVKGEVSGYKVIQNKWAAFDLKDESSVMACFLGVWQLNVQIEDGMEIKVAGRPGLYVPQGRYTFRVERIEPVGEGALRRAFQLTQAKLAEEGLFDEKYKKSIPRFPKTIGLITSTDAAAYTDVLKILNARWGDLDIFVYDVLVQGTRAPDQIVQALDFFNKIHPVDVLILTRGGGSLEDLQAFNSESVCRAVFASKIPVICGVGHERDISLAELAADVRASTPTNAAEIAVPDKKEILNQLNYYQTDLSRSINQQIQAKMKEVAGYLSRFNSIILSRINLFQETRHHLALAWQKFNQQVIDYQYHLKSLRVSLAGNWQDLMGSWSKDLSGRVSLLETLNPMKVLGRGYSITYSASGKVIRRPADVKQGEEITTRMTAGEILSQVKKLKSH